MLTCDETTVSDCSDSDLVLDFVLSVHTFDSNFTFGVLACWMGIFNLSTAFIHFFISILALNLKA